MPKPQGMPIAPDKPIDSTDDSDTTDMPKRPLDMPKRPLDMPKRPLDMPPIKNNIVNRPDANKPIVDELIPNCTAIAQDVMDGKINEKNFIYLSPKCDTQIMNALKSSR